MVRLLAHLSASEAEQHVVSRLEVYSFLPIGCQAMQEHDSSWNATAGCIKPGVAEPCTTLVQDMSIAVAGLDRQAPNTSSQKAARPDSVLQPQHSFASSMMLVLQLRHRRQMCNGKMLAPVLPCLGMKTSSWRRSMSLGLKLQMLSTTGPLRCAPAPTP